MDEQFYRTLRILVKDTDVMAKVHSYVTAREEVLRNQLEITQDTENAIFYGHKELTWFIFFIVVVTSVQ